MAQAESASSRKVSMFLHDAPAEPSGEGARMEYRNAADQAEFESFGAELAPHYQISVPFGGEPGSSCSLTVVEFGPGYLLPLHSHGVDCLYYVERGSLRMGNKTLGPGDGFFVAKDQPYGYRAGPDGVRVLEFRAGRFDDFRLLEPNVQGWKKRFRQSVSTAASKTQGA